MKKNEPIAKIMSKDLITARAGQKLSEVRAMLCEYEIHHLPIVDAEQLVGIVSTTDIFRASFGSSDEEIDSTLDFTTSLDQLMTKAPVTVSSGDPIRKAAEILAEGRFHALPVVDNGALVGIVSSTDLIRYLLEQY